VKLLLTVQFSRFNMNLPYFRCASEVGKIATSSDDSTVSLLGYA
jgi:hypothetical protein